MLVLKKGRQPMRIRCNNETCKHNYNGRTYGGQNRQRMCKAEDLQFTKHEGCGWNPGLICQSWERKEDEKTNSNDNGT
jgi:hypothetical protein